WGINIALCNEYCSRQRFPMVFNYQHFLGRVTNYLLPWLALTAQLPYEAGSVMPNVMSFSMAVGSPMLITFSLMMTIHNRRWLERKYKRFNRHYKYGPFITRLVGVRSFLEAAQQVPIRMSRGNGWLASLILLPGNDLWWTRLDGHIRAVRRGLTLSLVAQISVAVTAWILTIIGSFGSALGNHAEGLVLASSTLWTWLVPIILGWITVGTQSKSDGLESALMGAEAYLALEPNGNQPAPQPNVNGPAPQQNGNNQPLQAAQQSFKVVSPQDPHDLDVFGFSIFGDEIQQGPVYNYARMFTWRVTAQRLFSYFERAADNVQSHRDMLQAQIHEDQMNHGFQGGIPLNQLHNLQLDLQSLELSEYPTEDEVGPDLWFHLISAFFMAVFVQWGTAGAAIVIAYLTDAKGLGCRSGSYLLYGVLSTIAFGLFFLSAVASRGAVLRGPTPSNERRSLAFQLLRAAAVVARLGGRVVAVANAAWIVLSSLWELVGFFDNCWCEGTQLSWGDRAWVALFKNTIELKDYATASWAGGVFMTSFVMAASYGVFWL
ncbi:hypothetical protein B0T18DRAFT_307083, partial [Schizothecium vesticola]